MAITSPFFCLADFFYCRLQPVERLLLLCLTPHLGSESALRRHKRFRHRPLFQNSPDGLATPAVNTTMSSA